MTESIGAPGTFACSFALGGAANEAPCVTVDGVGRLSWPLCAEQAITLRGACVRAPYGKGSDTVVDESVRRAWQADADKVDVRGWDGVLRAAVDKACAELGSSARSTTARLYKLLLYEPEGHFKEHCDTEKEPGMYATLVMQLPAAYAGGSLRVAHKGKTKTFDWSAASEDGLFASAFYADCTHELLPVTEGLRLCLVYNLLWASSGPLPAPVDHSAQREELGRLGARLVAAEAASPRVLGVLLEHKYTETNLGFGALKGRDRSVVDTLRAARAAAAGQPAFDVSLVLIQRQMTGDCDCWYDGSRRGRSCRYGSYSSDDDEELIEGATMDEVYTDETHVVMWVCPDGSVVKRSYRTKLPKFDPFQDIVNLEDGLLFGEDEDPDRREYEGYTGNTGPTLDYFYYRAAAVLCPASLGMRLACEVSLEFAMATLRARVERGDSDVLESAGIVVDKVACARDRGDVTKVLPVLVELGPPASALASRALAIAHEVASPWKAKDLALAAAAASALGFEADLNSLATIALALAPATKKAHALCAILAEPEVSSAAAGGSAAARRMHAEHRAALVASTAEPPAFTWRQPEAKFVGSQQAAVLAFLRSDEESTTISGFKDATHAYNWARKYFGYGAIACTATPTAGARVSLRKTKDHHARTMERFESEVAELARLDADYGEVKAAEPPPGKRRRTRKK